MPGVTYKKVGVNASPWEVDFGRINGRRRRRYYKTKAEATEALRLFKDEIKEAGQVWSHMAPVNREGVVRVLEAIRKSGTTLDDVWAFYRENKPGPSGELLGDTVEEFIQIKGASGISDKYREQLVVYLGQFTLGREGVDLAEITPDVLEGWFSSRKESRSTRQTGINRLSSFFSFCVRRGHIKENPCQRVERVRVPHVKPEILSVDQCQKLVDAAARTDTGMLTYLGLALFCGIRPDETLRIDRSEIDLDRGLVFLDAEKSKVRNRRIITLIEPAKRCITAGGPVPKVSFKKRFDRLRKEAGIEKWPHDALRKTAASHFYNIYGIEKATEQLGHSAGVLLRVYRELVPKEETERWLAIGRQS